MEMILGYIFQDKQILIDSTSSYCILSERIDVAALRAATSILGF
jgi:hypothetical protein